MLEHNARLESIKREVMYEVAKAAFHNDEAAMEQIPYDMIPGPQPQFRCCIYKEREIIRQRVRLARGLSPNPKKDDKNIVQVINSACEGCPITRFTVTDNCQKCVSKRCQAACHFKAISMGKDRAYIDPDLCHECGQCAKACPYNAIADLMRPCKRSCPVDAISMDENRIVKIDEEKCIHCGSCIKDCPFGAISDRSFMVDVIKLLQSGRPVYACVAPAIEGQFGKDVTIGILNAAVKDLGFADLYEAALGADLVADSESKEWTQAYNEGKKMTTSCCPAFVTMIKKHYPGLLDNVSTTISPMTATARLIKAIDPKAIVVFIGPCVAKKNEVLENITQDSADYALTFEELDAMFEAKEIDLSSYDGKKQQGSIYGKRFSESGGVTKAVVEALSERGDHGKLKVRQCNGAADCKKALLLMKVGRLPEDFVEGMVCEGGCMNGPKAIRNGAMYQKDREAMFKEADGRMVKDNVEACEKFGVSLHKK
ncbi:periplasmic [Fe] hydrogenase [Lachnospiraceae bacterium KM106-2]|nr:periplasmic [Fe] hydrogenase [Lachnospiraceae bacterium KM106-2]